MPDSAYSNSKATKTFGTDNGFEGALCEYLRENDRYVQLGLSSPPTFLSLSAFEHGQSNPTFKLEISDRSYVLRKQPNGMLLPGAHDVVREARLMSALTHKGVPVPRIFIIEPDQAVIGTQFFVMEFVDGVIYRDPSLPEIADPAHRQRIYHSMATVMSAIHGVVVPASQPQQLQPQPSYISKQLHIWSSQYRRSLTPELGALPEISELVEWLEKQVPAIEQSLSSDSNTKSCLVHGDFRLDNIIFSPDGSRVLAVLDWELSSPVGTGVCDLAYCALAWYLPKEGFLTTLALGQRAPTGIPSVADFVAAYNQQSHSRNVTTTSSEWLFYLCLGIFRISSICQGVYARSVQGNASSSTAHLFRAAVPILARCALDLIRAFPRPGKEEVRLHPSAAQVLERLEQFLRREVIPAEDALNSHAHSAQGSWPDRGQRWVPHADMLRLADRARNEYRLWNLWLPKACSQRLRRLHPDWNWGELLPHSSGLTNGEYAKVAVVSGYSLFLPALINCAAPDTGNMELIANFASAEQRVRYLLPLLQGRARSCFAMTEKNVSSSDPTQLRATATLSPSGEEWIISGRKWWTTGACDPRCSICLFVARTEPDTAPPHRRHSIFMVPMDSLGVTVVRPLVVFGYDDAPGGHAEVLFNNVRIPVGAALLGGERGRGRGFELAQSRLGPGRLHHCARLVGHGKRALEEIVTRGSQRKAFGRALLDLGGNSERLARAVIAVESALASVHAAADHLDRADGKLNGDDGGDHKGQMDPSAQRALAICKVLVPEATQGVLDFAIQLHGGGGLSADHPLAAMWAAARTLRLVDGPDEVHLRTISKVERQRLAIHPGVGSSRL